MTCDDAQYKILVSYKEVLLGISKAIIIMSCMPVCHIILNWLSYFTSCSSCLFCTQCCTAVCVDCDSIVSLSLLSKSRICCSNCNLFSFCLLYMNMMQVHVQAGHRANMTTVEYMCGTIMIPASWSTVAVGKERPLCRSCLMSIF